MIRVWGTPLSENNLSPQHSHVNMRGHMTLSVDLQSAGSPCD